MKEWLASSADAAFRRGQDDMQRREQGFDRPFNPPQDFAEDYERGWVSIVELNELRLRKKAEGGCAVAILFLGSSLVYGVTRLLNL